MAYVTETLCYGYPLKIRYAKTALSIFQYRQESLSFHYGIEVCEEGEKFE